MNLESYIYHKEDAGVIYCGDCREILPILPKVDLVLVDPPYGINYKDWDKIENFITYSESWVKECFELLKDNGSFYSFMGWTNVAEFKILLDKYGSIKNWITWHRTKGRGCQCNFKSMKEEILFYTKSNNYIWNEQRMLKKHVFPYVKNSKPRGWFTNEDGEKCRWTGLGNVWFYTVPFWKMPEYMGHPAQKPVMMFERMVLCSSNENDLVLDPFMGSGTTLVAAKKLGRKSIGIEISEKYCEIAVERLRQSVMVLA